MILEFSNELIWAGSECNLLNSSSKNLYEVKLLFDCDKVRMKHSKPRTHKCTIHSLPSLCWSFGATQAVFWLVYTMTIQWRLNDESNWVIVYCFISIAIQMHHSHFSSLARNFLFLLSFPLFSFLFLKTHPPPPPKNQGGDVDCGGGDLETITREELVS